MNIQSLSIVVPTGKCWNNCEFCVSKMHSETYGASIIKNDNEIPQSYINRMNFVRDEGCNSMIITGTAEPQQNMPFILNLLEANKCLRKPFYNISIQTTGSGFAPVMFEECPKGSFTVADAVIYCGTFPPVSNEQALSLRNIYALLEPNIPR